MSSPTTTCSVGSPTSVSYPWWEGAGCLVVRLDGALHVSAVNGTAERLFSMNLAGRSWLSLLEPECRDRALALARAAASDAWTTEVSLTWRLDASLLLQTRLLQIDDGFLVCSVVGLADALGSGVAI